ncbi:MAG: aminomethyl-transferring glycine dehydrogenase subunit GcvPA [Trueperaceae bacterium]|nr:aminomethyl-transferring glycine dehydrogenase subunit GcvPA [Trueperaceae bacterium]MCO5174363.1 aminomethyl-transferring glycine dehydrogenase subunit GcvPA [Trueperaceae bacterium]MCW5820700.1 aminomethyl-transferring glycine dehydrogenase subunit GcvPA [Trueperaceae bacterium]
MRYIPHTREDVERALAKVGAPSIDALFADLPQALQDPDIQVPTGMDEAGLLAHLRALAAKNRPEGPNFLGGGARRHFTPSVTAHLAMQSEFVTAYTPYQPEVAQGILQATFEYQTIMSELTGLPVSNASMYDGASAVAEGVLLAMRQTGRDRVLVSRGVHPETRAVIATYLAALDLELELLDLDPYTTPTPGVTDDVACVVAQQPNYLGYVEDMPALTGAAHASGALLVAAVDPLSLAVLAPPGEYGADIAAGDGQTLGNPLNFGGPAFGFMVVGEELIRQFPGRLVGETVDVDGKRAFVLTLQAREQHIRRSKAKSNICSNHQLTAIMAAINVAALGPAGLRDLAVGSVVNAHKLADALKAAGFAPRVEARFFNEFVLPVGQPPAKLRSALARSGVHAGVEAPAEYGFGDAIILSATESTTAADIDALVTALVACGEGRVRALEAGNA